MRVAFLRVVLRGCDLRLAFCVRVARCAFYVWRLAVLRFAMFAMLRCLQFSFCVGVVVFMVSLYGDACVVMCCSVLSCISMCSALVVPSFRLFRFVSLRFVGFVGVW